MASSAQALQSLVDICELELKLLDMAINASKSACMRFGPRYKSTCANVTVSGLKINWVSYQSYLESSFNFKSSYSATKAGYYKAFNAIFGKVDHIASEEVLFALLKYKCLPILLYGRLLRLVLLILQSDSRSNLPVSEMTYIVSSGTLNSNMPYHTAPIYL